MMGGNTETTQRGAITAEMVPLLAKEAKERQEKTQFPHRSSPFGLDQKTKDLAPKGRSSEVAAKAVGVGPAKKKHEMRLPLTKTQREILSLLQRGYPLEVEKRGPGYVSHLGGAEIGGRGIRFDTAKRMIDECLVEKLTEDERTTKYRISPTAIQILDSPTEARR